MAMQQRGASETAPIIRPFQLADTDGVRALLNAVFDTELFTREWLTWKYGPGSAQGELITLVVESAARDIIGFIGFWPRKMTLNGTAVLAYQALDAAVHPAFQRQGLYSRMVERATDCARQVGASAFWGFPNANSLPASQKIGWTPIKRLRWFMRPLSAVWPRRRPQPIPFDALDLREQASADTRLRFARDADYLRWRYPSCPVDHYRYWELGSFQHGEAYAVTVDEAKGGVPQTIVVDLVGANLTEAEQGAALKALVRRVSEPGRALALLEGTLACSDRTLLAHGFFPVPGKGRWTIQQPLTGAGRALPPFAAMQVCPGDTDTF